MCMFMHGFLVKLTSQTFVWPHINIIFISSFKCFKSILINKYLNLKDLNIKSLSFIEKPWNFNNNNNKWLHFNNITKLEHDGVQLFHTFNQMEDCFMMRH